MKIDDWMKKGRPLPLLLDRLQRMLPPANAQLLVIISAQHKAKIWSEFTFSWATENELTNHRSVSKQR